MLFIVKVVLKAGEVQTLVALPCKVIVAPEVSFGPFSLDQNRQHVSIWTAVAKSQVTHSEVQPVVRQTLLRNGFTRFETGKLTFWLLLVVTVPDWTV